jgi:DNA-binding MarR family transcriptional regulator
LSITNATLIVKNLIDNSEKTLKLELFMPYRMVNLANKMSLALSEIYKNEFDISIPEWRILAQLAEQKTMNAKDIGNITSMDKSKVSRAVAALTQKNYLSKQQHDNDKRSANLALTPQGKELYRMIAPQALDWEKKLIDALDASEYRDLVRILNKLDKQVTLITPD